MRSTGRLTTATSSRIPWLLAKASHLAGRCDAGEFADTVLMARGPVGVDGGRVSPDVVAARGAFASEGRWGKMLGSASGTAEQADAA